MVLVLLIGGCELRFQDPFSHPADNTDTDIFDDDSDDDGPPYGGVISFRTITVDGVRDDWDGVTSIIYDAAGDSTYSGAGGDIVRVRLAADDTFLYFAIDLADDTPDTTQELQYRINIWDPAAPYDGLTFGNVEMGVEYDGANWNAFAFQYNGTEGVTPPGFDIGWGAAGSPTGPVELQIERSMVLQKSDLLFSGLILRRSAVVPDLRTSDNTDEWIYTLP